MSMIFLPPTNVKQCYVPDEGSSHVLLDLLTSSFAGAACKQAWHPLSICKKRLWRQRGLGKAKRKEVVDLLENLAHSTEDIYSLLAPETKDIIKERYAIGEIMGPIDWGRRFPSYMHKVRSVFYRLPDLKWLLFSEKNNLQRGFLAYRVVNGYSQLDVGFTTNELIFSPEWEDAEDCRILRKFLVYDIAAGEILWQGPDLALAYAGPGADKTGIRFAAGWLIERNCGGLVSEGVPQSQPTTKLP
jgi:hypothetical protein